MTEISVDLTPPYYMQTIKIHSPETCKSHNSPPFSIIKKRERNNHGKEYIHENFKNIK